MSVDVDNSTTKYLVLVFESGHRTTVSLDHTEGLELSIKLREYYGNIEVGAIKAESEKKTLLNTLWRRLTHGAGK